MMIKSQRQIFDIDDMSFELSLEKEKKKNVFVVWIMRLSHVL